MKQKPKKMNEALTRRKFIKLSAAAVGAMGFPHIVPSAVFGRSGAIAPSNRIVMAGIGFGMMGVPNMKAFLEKDEVQWVAVCDIDEKHLKEAQDIVNQKYGNTDCAVYKDFRELYKRKDLDAVSIAVPDHWHAILSIAAAREGLDIYAEKPLSHDLLEGRAMCDAVKRYGRVWQTGSWQRSVDNFHHACELVRNGRIGKIQKVEVGLPQGHYDFAGTAHLDKYGPPPPELDYDFWVGPAPYSDYCTARVHMNWRWVMDFGGGQLMDWVGHHVDIAHWGLDFDRTGPVTVEGWGEFPRRGIWNSPTRYYVKTAYADGTPMDIAGGFDEIWGGTKWIGEHGWVWVNRGAQQTDPPELWDDFVGPGENRLYKSRDHYQDFLDCVRSRKQTITPIETAHRSASVGHLGVITIELGRKIRWDPETETILDDPEATRLLGRACRSPWQLGL
jgi:predicted dehydrogenase